MMLRIYDAQGNIINLTTGLPAPIKLESGQSMLFNLQENPTSLTGSPKFLGFFLNV